MNYINQKNVLDLCQQIIDEAKGYSQPQMAMGAIACRDAIKGLVPVPSTKGYAVIYDFLDPYTCQWRDDMYEAFDSPEEANTAFLQLAANDETSYHNPRIVLILEPIKPWK